jgi:hypothetical protein
MLQLELSVAGTRIENLECDIRPPGSKRDAIPLEATVNTIRPFEQIVEAKVFHTKVFPLSP